MGGASRLRVPRRGARAAPLARQLGTHAHAHAHACACACACAAPCAAAVRLRTAEMIALVRSIVSSLAWSQMQLYGSLNSVAKEPRLRQVKGHSTVLCSEPSGIVYACVRGKGAGGRAGEQADSGWHDRPGLQLGRAGGQHRHGPLRSARPSTRSAAGRNRARARAHQRGHGGCR